MALTESERQKLARLEQQLTSDDPQLAQSLSAPKVDESTDPLVFGLVLIAILAAILFLGVAATVLILVLTGMIAATLDFVRKVRRWNRSHDENF